MAWVGPLDENLCSFRSMLDNDDWYGRDSSVMEDIKDPFYYPSSVTAFDGNGGIPEGLLGCSPVYPTSPVNNVYGTVNEINGAQLEVCPEPKVLQNLTALKNRKKGKGQSANGDGDEETDCGKVGDGGDEGEANHGPAPTPVINNNRGRKNGMPAKNLMAERRRRKKLNDRLYMLRSVVPKISKMDRASILGDAVEYLKELLQRINDLHNELEISPQKPIVPSPFSFQPLTSTEPALHCQMKEESPVSLPNLDSQPARVEVGTREGRALNIHMFCARRPGLLLSTMRALDGLGLDVKQAVISCFNGFALDVFQAEQSTQGDIAPEEIKALLLHTAGCQPTM